MLVLKSSGIADRRAAWTLALTHLHWRKPMNSSPSARRQPVPSHREQTGSLAGAVNRFPALLGSSILEIMPAASNSLKDLWTVERGQFHFWARYLDLAPNSPRFNPAASSSIPATRTFVR